MAFAPAQRRKAKLRLAITGPSGSGKTWGALQIAKGIGGKIAVVDTERGSASLYTHLVQFDVDELAAPYTPERFIECINGAVKGGYSVLIIDSITPEWGGVGGCLELVDKIAAAKFRGNSWSAWNEVTPRHRAFLDALLRAPIHIIATMRSKTETAQTEENGRKKVTKLGMKSEQRDGIEYEFTTVLDLVHDGHTALASKDRTGLFSGDPTTLTPETGARLMEWLESGAETVDEPPLAKAPEKPADGQEAEDEYAARIERVRRSMMAAETLEALQGVKKRGSPLLIELRKAEHAGFTTLKTLYETREAALTPKQTEDA